MAFANNGRDAADRIREEGWKAEFLTRRDAQRRATVQETNTRLRPLVIEAGNGENQFSRILGTLARLEHSDGLEFAAFLAECESRIPRDTTVVAVLGIVTPQIAAALGNLVLRGLLVTALVVSFDLEPVPEWAKPPDWAEMLLAQGIDCRAVNSEEAVANLCTEALVR